MVLPKIAISLMFVIILTVLISAVSAIEITVDGKHGVANETCCTGTYPCKTLTLALECIMILVPSTTVSLIINEGQYELLNNYSLTLFKERTGGLTITGNCPGVDACVKISCVKGAGLSFIKSNNVKLETLVLSGCGVPNNSTSLDLSGDKTFAVAKSALYFLLCQNVTLNHVSVLESDGTGVMMYSTVGKNTITNSAFLSNTPEASSFIGGGGLYIEFSYCYPGDSSCLSGASNIPKVYTRDALYEISNCSFSNNIANVSDALQNTFILPQKGNHIAFGRGGGLSLFFKGEATNNIVNIDSCEYSHNTALWGGGIFIEIQDNSSHNRVYINNSIATNNECLYKDSSSRGTGGGGARLGYIFFSDTHAEFNSISFENCTFSSNSAYYGGGLSFYAARESDSNSPTNTIAFSNSIWRDNVARAGSGADLSVWHTSPKGAITVAVFTNCSFEKNSGDYTIEDSTVVGIGALYIDSIPVHFSGQNFFRQNTHSALAAVTTGIYMLKDSVTHFIANSGRIGGAIALLGAAFIETEPLSALRFTDNRAVIAGGAIYAVSIGEHDLIDSLNCFIRFSDITVTPDNWNSSFYFSSNIANDRNESIFASTLLTCQWGGSYGNASSDLSEVFCWNDMWDYDGGNCTTEVRTSPAIFTSNSEWFLELIPGKRQKTRLSMWDDRHSDVTDSSVFLARSLSDDIEMDNTSVYVASNYIKVLSDNDTTSGTIMLETVDPRVVQVTLNVSIIPCPPGMVLNDSSCICGHNFNGMIQCDGRHFSTQIRRGNWIGYHQEDNDRTIVASRTPYFNKSEGEWVDLPDKVSNLDDRQCRRMHRKGTLCGECVDDYGPAIHSYNCVHCSVHTGALLYLLSQFLPLTLTFAAVAILDIRVTSEKFNALVFFAQVLPTVFSLNAGGAITLNGAGQAVSDTYSFIYNVFNLEFFGIFDICLSPNLSTINTIMITYLEAVYPLVLIGMTYIVIYFYEKDIKLIKCMVRPFRYCLVRFQRRFGIERSLTHTFAAFILLSYTRLILVSLLLLAYTPLVTEDGETHTKVLYYDGTITFMSKEHAVYVFIAVVVLFLFAFLTPLLLIAPSLAMNFRKKWPKYYPRFCSEENNTSAKFTCVTSLWLKINNILEAFHGCYRNGATASVNIEHSTQIKEQSSYDYRCFAGFYMILRIALFSTFAFTRDWFEQYAFLQFFCILGLLGFLHIRPYKNDTYNKLDAAMFVLLLAINTLTMYNYGITALGYDPSTIAFTIQTLLVFTPLLYIAFLIYKWIKPQCRWCAGKKDPEQVGLIGERKNELTASLSLARGMDPTYQFNDPDFTNDDKHIPTSDDRETPSTSTRKFYEQIAGDMNDIPDPVNGSKKYYSHGATNNLVT